MKRRFTNFSSFKLSVTILSVILFSVISFTKSMAQCPVGMGDIANMTIMGNYTGNGRDSIQIASTASHDTMTVTGNSDITNDTLDLFICSGFAPTNGMTITFWDSGTLTGTFKKVNILGTGSNLNNWTIRYNYPNTGEISAYYCGVSVTIMDLDGVELCVGTAYGFQAVRSPLATVVTNYNWTSTNAGGAFNPNNLGSASTTDFVAGTASVADSIIVEMVTNQGCSVFDTVEVTINPDIIVSITNNPTGVVPTEMCENGILNLKGAGNGGNGTLNYSWQVFVNSVAANASNFFSVPNSNNNMTGMTTTLFSIPNGTITGITDIDIILNVSDATSCETSDTVNITVVPEPDVALVTPPTSPVCSGIDDNVSFTVSNPNGFGDGFYWTVSYPMGVSGGGDGCTTGTTITDTVTNTTNASVTLTYNVFGYSEINMSDCDGGCTSATGITVNVTILPEPVVADTTFTVCSDIAIAYNLPDLGDNGLDIDSFNITAVVDGGLTGSASSGNGITSLTELAADVFGNTTNASHNVVYTVVPFTDGCAGDTFLITVIVNPEPVTNPSLATAEVCSDIQSGIVLNTNGTSVAAADWDIVSIDEAMGLTAGGGNATVGDGQLATALENDVFTNTTALPLDVEYVVVPVSADGCAGDTFTITLTINPEPVTNPVIDSFEVCSDILANIVLSTNGTSVAADDWDIVSIDVAVGLTPDGGNASVGDNQTSTALEDDVFTNTTSGPLNVEYQVVPVSADGCAGDTFTIVVVVNPEPVTSPGLELAMVCSDVNSGIILNTNGTSVSADVWDIISITAEPGLSAAVGNATAGDGQADDELEDDVFTNITPNELEVVYVVVPVSADGCAGDTFNITLTVKPEPVVADQTESACSDTPIEVTLGDDVDGPSAATYNITSVDLNGLPAISELAYSGNLTTGNQNFSDRLGMVFTTNAPVSVNQLGAFDSNQDGLNLPITVGIIRNSDQVVMAGPVTLSGTMEPLGADGRHRMANISPVVLAPDTYTIVAVGYGATELNGNSTVAPFLTTTTNTGGGLITYNSSSYGGTGFGFPTTPFPTPDVFHAGTFRFGSSSVGNGVMANAIFNDSYTNTTNAPVDVVYEVVPISADGCAGDTFTVTVTINPEPVTDPALATATSCSDDSISVVLNTNGTSVSADTWDLISVVVDVDLTANVGNQVVADDLDEYAISGDSYTNITNAPQDVVYTVVPVSADGCAGDTFEITVTINPEPVVADTSFTVCSDEAIGYNLPDFGDNALDIDSFEISANVDIDLSGTPTEGTVTSLTAIASDVYTNVTNTTQDVVYSVIPYSDGCAGDTFDITVTINPEPVVDDSTFTVCSDEAIGYDLPAVGDNGLGIDSFNVTAVVGSGLTGIATVGTGLSGSDIAADDYNNVTTGPDTVVYTITPFSGGCAGDSYDLTVIVNPEPVVADSSFSICSDVAIGYNLPDAGDNGLDIDSFGITAIVDMNLTGTPTEGTVTSLTAIAGDIYNNISMAPHMVVYTITPYTNGCAGDLYNLTVTVNPEPVGEDSTITVCSDENFTYNPQGSIINQTSGMMIVDTIFYTGAMQTYTVPMSVTSITIEAFGAAGAAGANGNSSGGPTMGGPGGAGGRAIGNLSVMPGQMLNVFVGGAGSTMGTGGFNGGGNGGSAISGGGGGASDVRYPGTSSGDRLLVAGGGGGGGRGGCESTTAITGGAGGVGGNGNGANGTDAPTPGGFAGGGFGGVGQIGGGAGIGCGGFLGSPGANGTVAGQGGNGGAGQSCCCFSFGSLPGGGGGGGGYVGGGGAGGGSAGTTGCSGNDKGGGGGGAGGSSYFGGVSGGSATNGVNSGDGYVIISYSLPLMSSTFEWEITDIVGTVTGSSIGDSGTGVIQDSMHNVSNSPAVVTYSIVPTSDPEGCVGDTFTFIVTVNPEPVVTDTAFSVCSDVAIGYNLPDLDDDGGDIDSFDITAVVGGGLTGTASQGNGITNLAFIAADVFNNVTPNAIDVVYTVTPYFYGCAGDPYTVTVTIDAEPVVANQTVTVCSDVPLGINFNTDPNGPVVEFYTINSITTTLTASAGNPMVGDSFAIDSIANDAWTNLTNANQTVVYNVTPVSVDGCEGAPFTVTATIRPEPVVNDINAVTCSDVTFGGQTQLPNGGTNIGVSQWNFESLVLGSPLTTPFPGGTTNNPANYPFTLSNTGLAGIANRGGINNDAFNNIGSFDANAVYSIIPIGTDPPGPLAGCVGDTFFVTGVIHPEPVGTSLAPVEQCSGVPFEINLNDYLTNITPDPDSLEPVSYVITGITQSPIALVVVNSQGVVDSILSITATNFASLPITLNVSIQPTSRFGCVGSNFIVPIIINNNPDVSLSPNGDNTLCEGESRTLQGSVVPNISPATYNYEYTITAGTGTLTNANTISATVTATTGPLTVQFKATNPTTGCSDSISFTFTVNPNPTFTTVADTIFGCAVVPNGAQGVFYLPNGASAASGTLTFHVSASDANAGIGAIGNPTNYTGNNNQEIWVRLTGVNGCYTVESFILSVSPLPNVVITGDLSYCEGESTILTASGGDFYSWNDINNTSGETLVVTEPGTYTVTVTNDIGCSATASVTVTEHPKPNASITASETAVCYGESITLTANGGEVVEWSTGGSDNPIIFFPEVGDSTVSVVVENVFGCLDTASIILTGYPIPDPILVNNLDTCALIFGGNTAEFDLAASSDSTLTFHLTESDAQAGLGAIVNPNNYTGTNGQLIWWSYVDVNGCIAIGSFELIVNPLPTVLASADESAICLGEDVTLEASAPMGSNYLWSPGGQTTETFVDTPAVTTTYTVVVTDLNGCINSSEVTVTVNPNPTGTITGTDGIECEGTTVTLVAGGGDAYVWSNGVGNTSSVDVTITSDTTFTVVVTNAFGCTDTTSVDIDLSPELIWDSTNVVNVTCNGGSDGEVYALATGGTAPLTYAWEDGDGNSIGSSSSVTGLDAGSYHLTVTDDEGCSITVTLQVTEPDALQIVAVVSNNLECNGDSTGNTSGTILGGVGPYTIYIEGSSYLDTLEDPNAFYFENLVADTYVITAVDSNGCEVSINVEITEPTPLLISATPTDAECNGGNGTITVFGSGGTPGYSYFVNFPAPNTPANSPSFNVPAGTYTVYIEDTHSCRDSVEVTIGEPTAVVVDSIIATNESCDGANDGTATAYVSGGTPGYTYSWSNTQSTSIATGLGEGTYYVTITDINGCVVIDSVEIGVNAPAPPVVLNCPVNITLYVQDCDISYSWLAPTIVDNCLTTQLTLDLDGAENEGFTLGIQQVNFEPGVYNITYTDETADPDTIACEFTVTVIDSIAPVIVCPDTVQVQCVEDIPAYYTNYLDFIADGGILDDNCTVSLSTFAWVSDTGLLAPECTNRDTITRIYSVEDIYGNTGLCEQTIVVYDTIAPTITLPADTIVDCDAIMTPAQLGTATAEDNCQTGSVNVWWADSSTQSGDVDSCDNYNYVITRTWYAEDECGNIDSLDQTIMVQDTTKPEPVCKNFFVYLDTNGEASILPDSINNGSTDNCMPASSLKLALDVQDFDCDDVPSVEVTLFVKDACGNTSTCTAIVTVADTVAPVAVCQTAITIYLDNLGNVSIDSTDIDNGSSDNCAIKNMILSDSEFDCDDVATSPNVVEMYVIDFYNNADTCSTNVTVLDTIAPIALCQDITVQLDGTGNVSVTAGMINNGSNDACGIDTMTVSPNTFDCNNLNANTIVLTVTDVNGNTQTCTATVTVQDTLDPVAICANITVSLDSATGKYALTALDSTNIVSTSSDNCSFVATLSPTEFDCDDVFAAVPVTVILTDPSNNSDTCTALITVNDITDPTPACADITVELDSLTGEYVLNSADSTDIVNNTFDACGFVTEFSQDTFTCVDALSAVAVTVTFTDPSNNTSTCVVDVTVEDNFAPAPQCSDYTVELDSASGQYILNAIDSSEIVDGTFDACGFTADFSRDTFYCSDALSPVTITVTYEDPTGNISTCTADITVEDNFAPAPQCSDYTVELDSATGIYILNAIDSSEIVDGTFDACGFVTDFSRDTFNCLDVFAPVTITVTYEDPTGNVSTCTAEITVNDVTAPTAICNDITVSLDSTGNYTLSPTDIFDIGVGSFDACSYQYVLDTLSFTCSDVGPNNVTATFNDPSNNTSSCVSVVTVTDTIAPVIVCQDTTIYLDSLGEASITAEELVVSAIDACGIDTMTITQTDFTCSDIAGPFNEVITVTDVNGNSKTCTVIVTVVDSLAPWFTECKADTVMNTSPTGCFATYAGIYFAPIEDNCTPTNAIIVTSTAKVLSSGQIINMVVTPINGGVDGYYLSVPLAMFGNNLPVGPNLLTVYATDGQGNKDSCQWTVQVNDVWAPSVQNCPSNITVNVNPTTCMGQAFWGGPTASDNCSGVSLMTQNNNQYFSGAFFPGGTNNVTTVQYTATDNSGNTNTSCSFTVTVVGTCTPPMPDISPEHITGGTNYNPGQTKSIVVRVRNLSANPTTAPVVFFVQKMNPNFTIGVNPTQTNATVGINNYSLSNSDWDIVEQPTRWRFTSKTGVVINGNTEKLVGISVTANNFPMSSANLSTNVVAGTGGGETPTNNNNKTNVLLIN